MFSEQVSHIAINYPHDEFYGIMAENFAAFTNTAAPASVRGSMKPDRVQPARRVLWITGIRLVCRHFKAIGFGNPTCGNWV